MVSLLPTIDGRLFRIKGGNRLLPERLIAAANASLHQGIKVTKVHRTKGGLFELHHKSSSADETIVVRIHLMPPLEATLSGDCNVFNCCIQAPHPPWLVIGRGL